MTASREIRLKSRPVGVPATTDFELATVEVSPPGDGEIQVRNLWMSVDPYMRGRMTDRKSYVPPFELGKVLQGGAIGEVVGSNDPDFKPGDVVSTMFGWREVFNVSPKALAAAGMGAVTKIDTHGLPPQTFLGVAGMPGLTAYAGLLRIAALNSARPFGRFALCGMISQYNETGKPVGPWNIAQIVGKSLRLEGFIVSNHYDLAPQFIKDMAGWIGAGQMKWNETIEEGVDRAPEAFIKLFKGENLGKMLVKLG